MKRLDNIEDALDIIFSMAPHVRILHHIPGRIRMRASREITDMIPDGMEDLPETISGIPGIRNVRVNTLIGSVLVEYDPAIFPTEFWENLVQGGDEANEWKKRLRKYFAGNKNGNRKNKGG